MMDRDYTHSNIYVMNDCQILLKSLTFASKITDLILEKIN